ncbi:MAG: hypothetical protein K8S15_12385 [Candidatus Aegiribacteria sp.]|nr:hypothetical protein [Candidatus Aegiribacteria sp.]
MILLILSLTAGWGLSYPLSNSGNVDSRFFFQPDEDRFLYSRVDDDLTLIQYGPFHFGTGLTIETYLGTGRSDSGTAFRVSGGHWNIRGTIGVDYKNILFSILADHDRFNDTDSADSSSLRISGLKLSIENKVDIRMEDNTIFLPAGYIPHYKVNIGFYRPRGGSFQIGHILNWSLHGELNFPLLSARRIVYGTLWHSDFYFHVDGSGSSRHLGEVYANHRFGRCDLALFLRHYLHDTQPIKPLKGETCLGMRFVW